MLRSVHGSMVRERRQPKQSGSAGPPRSMATQKPQRNAFRQEAPWLRRWNRGSCLVGQDGIGNGGAVGIYSLVRRAILKPIGGNSYDHHDGD